MARIAKSEHATILHLADVEQRKIPEIAASYGCTPANIYALLTRLRRPGPAAANDIAPVAASDSAEPDPPAIPPTVQAPATVQAPTVQAPATVQAPTVQAPLDLFVAAAPGRKERSRRAAPTSIASALIAPDPIASIPIAVAIPEAMPLLEAAPPRPLPAPPPPKPATEIAARGAARGGPPKPRLKSGYGLCTRTPEGDDNVTPFRSLEDLLSAVKPILRATANSAEPVWFSIQPVDLASIDLEVM